MDQKDWDVEVSSIPNKKTQKKCKRKRKLEFKKNFSILLKKIYTQNRNDDRYRIIEKKQLKKYKRKREIPKYEEAISNLLKRIKLQDREDNHDCIKTKKGHTNEVTSNFIIYRKMSEFTLHSYFGNMENAVCDPPKALDLTSLDKCLEGYKPPARVLSPCLPAIQNETIINENFYVELRTELCVSLLTCTEENVRMTESLNVIYSSKRGRGEFVELHSCVISPIDTSNANSLHFIHMNQHKEKMSSVTFQKYIFEELRRKDIFQQNFIFFDSNLRFTNVNGYYSYKMLQSSIALSKKISIFFVVQQKFIADYLKPKNVFSKHKKSVKKENLVTHSSNETALNTAKKDLVTSSNINNTIIDLFLLEIKIKQCHQLLKKFDITTDSNEGFKKLKLKSAKLIKTYKIIMDKRKKMKTRIKKSQKQTCLKNLAQNTLSSNDENSNLTSLKALGEANGELREHAKKSCYSPKKGFKNKRKRREDGEKGKPGRSKVLDECISRVNISKVYLEKGIKKSMHSAERSSSQCQNSDTIKEGGSGELYFEEQNIAEHKEISHDPLDKEIEKILSELPPIESISNLTEISEEKYVENINLDDSLNYELGNGKDFLIYPYVTT